MSYQEEVLPKTRRRKVFSIGFIITSDTIEWTGKWFKWVTIKEQQYKVRYKKFDDGWNYIFIGQIGKKNGNLKRYASRFNRVSGIKGFFSSIRFAFNAEGVPFTSEKEVQEFEELKWYLWMCGLQKWLRETHKIDLFMSVWGKHGEYYHVEDITKGLDKERLLIGNGGKGSIKYEEALEKGFTRGTKFNITWQH